MPALGVVFGSVYAQLQLALVVASGRKEEGKEDEELHHVASQNLEALTRQVGNNP